MWCSLLCGNQVGELAVVGPNGVIGSAEINLAQFATLNVGGSSSTDIVKLRSKRSLAGAITPINI